MLCIHLSGKCTLQHSCIIQMYIWSALGAPEVHDMFVHRLWQWVDRLVLWHMWKHLPRHRAKLWRMHLKWQLWLHWASWTRTTQCFRDREHIPSRRASWTWKLSWRDVPKAAASCDPPDPLTGATTAPLCEQQDPCRQWVTHISQANILNLWL